MGVVPLFTHNLFYFLSELQFAKQIVKEGLAPHAKRLYTKKLHIFLIFTHLTFQNFFSIKKQIMTDIASPPCVKCGFEYTYQAQEIFICPECAHEWSIHAAAESDDQDVIIKDANGTVLKDGDTVSIIKDLKIKGSSSVVKVGTKVKNIRLVSGDHDIDCKIPGIGAMGLKSEFVRKV